MAAATTLLINIGSTIVIIFVNALALWLTIDNILKYAREGFKTALKTGAVAGIISFALGLIPTFVPELAGNQGLTLLFFIINSIVMLFLIKKFYGLRWGETGAAWVVVLVLSFLIGFVAGNFIGMVTPAFFT